MRASREPRAELGDQGQGGAGARGCWEGRSGVGSAQGGHVNMEGITGGGVGGFPNRTPPCTALWTGRRCRAWPASPHLPMCTVLGTHGPAGTVLLHLERLWGRRGWGLSLRRVQQAGVPRLHCPGAGQEVRELARAQPCGDGTVSGPGHAVLGPRLGGLGTDAGDQLLPARASLPWLPKQAP